MKYIILAAAVVLMGGVAVYVAQQEPVAEVSPDKAWKQTFVEPETAVRPAYFEEMRFKPEDAVEMRAPASDAKKKKN